MGTSRPASVASRDGESRSHFSWLGPGARKLEGQARHRVSRGVGAMRRRVPERSQNKALHLTGDAGTLDAARR